MLWRGRRTRHHGRITERFRNVLYQVALRVAVILAVGGFAGADRAGPQPGKPVRASRIGFGYLGRGRLRGSPRSADRLRAFLLLWPRLSRRPAEHPVRLGGRRSSPPPCWAWPWGGVGTALAPTGCLRKLAGFYIETIRNVPLILQLLFWYGLVTLANCCRRPARQALQVGDVFLSQRGLNLPWPEAHAGFGGFWPRSFVGPAGRAGVSSLLFAAPAGPDRLCGTARARRPRCCGRACWPSSPCPCGLIWAAWARAGLLEVPTLGGFNFEGGKQRLARVHRASTWACRSTPPPSSPRSCAAASWP